MISETCSCGASFESDEKQAMRQVREWRKSHVCRFQEPNNELRESHLGAELFLDSAPYAPELHIGFSREEQE
jgi:hypothetical protein